MEAVSTSRFKPLPDASCAVAIYPFFSQPPLRGGFATPDRSSGGNSLCQTRRQSVVELHHDDESYAPAGADDAQQRAECIQ
jgi:hypothetical protein